MRGFLSAIAITVLSQTAALAAPTLDAVLTCPKAGANRACLPVTLFNDHAHKGQVNFVPYVMSPNKGPQHLHVWGRLSGGAQTEFDLKVDWEDVYFSEENLHPAIAYLGRSDDNNPIILTKQGTLEITTAGVDVGASIHLLVDARHWTLMDQLIAADRGEYVFTSGTRIGIWDDERKLCIAAPIRTPGLLRVAPGNCAARPTPAAEATTAPKPPAVLKEGIDAAVDVLIGIDRTKPPSEDVQEEIWASEQAARGAEMGNLVPERTTLRHIQRVLPDAPNEEMGDIDRVWTRWGGMGAGIDVYRIKGSNVLVIIYTVDDC